MPLTVAATQQVDTNTDTAAAAIRRRQFEKFIRVKYHSVSVGGVHYGDFIQAADADLP